jgi:hypothetical protein
MREPFLEQTRFSCRISCGTPQVPYRLIRFWVSLLFTNLAGTSSIVRGFRIVTSGPKYLLNQNTGAVSACARYYGWGRNIIGRLLNVWDFCCVYEMLANKSFSFLLSFNLWGTASPFVRGFPIISSNLDIPASQMLEEPLADLWGGFPIVSCLFNQSFRNR